MEPPFPPLTAEADQRAEIVFFEALKKSPDERVDFLNSECGTDTRLRAEVDGLLRDHEKAGSFLSSEGLVSAEFEAELVRGQTEEAGAMIGPYKLLQQIGEGGFGVVWMAEQEKPVRRRVALKIIKLGMDTKDVVGRFEQERQALAMMDHPNIARVIDAGATPLGRPFFVMELVRGIKITEYCDQVNLPTAERLRLFVAVCHAVQHAHQKGIIHRDVKPSNILVTLHDGIPVPKVIDFGVAKATQERLTDRTVFTKFEQMIGTPAYMSPEQAEMSGLGIDTRSDIYSLGVLLYELLTSQTPFDGKELLASGLEAMRRVIREQEPPRPSTRLSTMLAADLTTVAKHRQSESVKLTHSIRGDLDWIVMKAMEKDRTRRYETASGLAADIQRHLSNEPVDARPPSNAYRFQKFVRRNKLAFAAAAAILAALVIGLGVSTWMFLKERHAREKERQALERTVAAEQEQGRLRHLAEAQENKARTEAGKSRQVAQFLKDMLKGVGPSVALGDDTKMLRKILDQTAERIGADLKDQPDVEVDLRGVIGTVYGTIGDYEKAVAMFNEALVLSRRIHGPEHPEVSELLNNLALELGNQGKLEDAEAMLHESLAMKRRLGVDPRDVATTIDNLAQVVADRGRFAEAEKLHSEALALKRAPGGDNHEAVATSLNNLAVAMQQQQKFADAERALREALDIQRKRNGTDTPFVAITLNNLANVVQQQNRIEESETLFREVLALQRKFLGNAHPNVATALNGLGLALHKQGKNDEAEPLLREGVDIQKKARSAAHPQTARLVGNLGRVLQGLQKPDEAAACYREALAIYGQLPGKEHPDVASWRNRLTILLGSQMKWPEVETMRREALAAARRAASGDGPHLEVADALIDLAYPLVQQNKFAEAEAVLLEGQAALQQIPEAPKELRRYALTGLVRLYEAWKQPEKSTEWQQKLDAFEKEQSGTAAGQKPGSPKSNPGRKTP